MQVGLGFDGARFKAEMERRILELRRAQRFAVNTLAFAGLRAVKAEVDRVFDRPTPWVRNGFRAVKVGQLLTSSAATAEDDRAAAVASDTGTGEVVAYVDWKAGSAVDGEGAKSIPAEKILAAQIAGGPRRLKRFERALVAIGAMPEGVIAVPARGARLDRYGNLSGGMIGKILSDLRAYTRGGQYQNRAAGTEGRFFAIPAQTNRIRIPAGIYEHRKSKRGRPKLIIAFVKPGTYAPRFDPVAVVKRTVEQETPAVWAAESARLQARWGS
jgi:hypothetical protein